MTYSANLSFFATKTSDTGAINSGIDGVPIGANTASTGKFTSVTNTGLTSGRIPYASTGGLLVDSANLTFNGTSLGVQISRTSSTNGIALTLSDDVTGTQTSGVYKSIRSTSNGGVSVSEMRFLEVDGTNNNTGLAFATAPTAGGLTERMRIDNNGNVGIGATTLSGVRLTVFSGGAGTNGQLKLGYDATAYWQIGRLDPAGTGSGNFQFRPDGGSSVFDITAAGKIGIGTSSPLVNLDVVNSSASGTGVVTTVRLNHAGTTVGDGPRLLFTSGTSTTGGCAIAGYGTALNAADMLFYAGGNTERMRITSAGNVGIGTSSPTEKLMVVGPIVVSGQLQGLRADSSTLDFAPTEKYTRIIATGPDSSTYASIIFATTTTTTYTERMRITYDGNLLLGTTTPTTGISQKVFQLDNGGNGGMILLGNSSTQSPNPRMFGHSTYNLGFAAGVTTGYINFYTNDTERMRILADGNLYVLNSVGIGTSSPNYQLHVTTSMAVGASGFNQQLSFTNDTIQSLLLGTGYTNLKLNPLGGNVGIGTSSPSYPLDVSGSTRVNVGSASNANGLLIQGSGQGQTLLSVQDSGTSLYQQVSFNYCKQAGPNYPLFEVIPYNNQPLLTWGGTLGSYAGVLNLNNPFSGYPITFSVGTSEKMRIDSNGNVGIGTSIPGTYGKVAISVTGTATPTTGANVGPASINLYNGGGGGTTNSTMGIFGWHAGEPGLGSGIGFSRDSSGDWAASIRFYTHPVETSNIGVITERMRIDGNGNISVGGFAPNTWQTGGYRFMQFLDATGLYVGGSSYGSQIGVNSYINSSSQWIYGGSDYRPARYEQFNGYHAWYKAGLGSAGTVISWTQAMTLTNENKLLVGQTSTSNGTGITLQPNLATAAVGHSGSFATVWNIPAGTVGIFAVNMGGGGQYGGARLFFVSYGAAGAGYNNAYVEVIGGPGGDQSGYSWSYNIASNGQFQMRNDVNAVAFVPTICMISLGG